MPDYRLERRFAPLADGGPIAGVDEAGRGPLAGPVVAAAVVLDWTRLPRSLRRDIDDSKALDRERRETIYAALQRCALKQHLRIGVGIASVEEIDRINILQATFLAMQRAVEALDPAPSLVLVDGDRAPRLDCRTKTIVDGDACCISIAAASIVAKVTRDRLMIELAESHPGYGWNTNVGYSTPEHYQGLARLGPTPHHRRSFAPVRNCLTQLTLDWATRGTHDAPPCPEPSTAF